MSVRGLALCVLGAATLAGCGEAPATVGLPQRILPAALDGYVVQEDMAARTGFNLDHTLVSQGRLYTLRYQGYVYGALEIASLRSNIDGSDIDQQQRIRAQIGSGNYRFYEVEGQWIGEQDTQDDRIFIWFPDYGADNTFEIVTLTNDFSGAPRFLAGIIRYQETGT